MGGQPLLLGRKLALQCLRLADLFLERVLCLGNAQRQFARPLQRRWRIIIAVAKKRAAARRIEFNAQGIQPFARSNYALFFDLLGMARLILGFVGLKAAGMKCRAPPDGRFGIASNTPAMAWGLATPAGLHTGLTT